MEDPPNFVGRNFEDVLMERSTSLEPDPVWTIRVAKRDNAYQVLTRDFTPTRVNVYIEDGIIVQQMLG